MSTFEFTLMAAVFTMLGGVFAIKFFDKRHLILAFSAGAVMGVALLDLLPEAIENAHKYSVSTVLLATAIGFAIYFGLSNWITIATHTSDLHCNNTRHKSRLGAGSLSLHSLGDGIGLGLAFSVSSHLGLVIALAVVCHDFSDGINTVNMILKNGGTKKQAFKWLSLDAIAPIIGGLSTFLFKVPSSILGIVFAVFAGFFLYIGASDLIPECHRNYPKHLTSILVFVGIVVMYIVTNIAG